MFTGIVEELGRVRAVYHHEGGARVEIAASAVLDDASLGASIAVNGCCLTVVAFDAAAGWWGADAVSETLDRTNLGALTPGDPVNLERPLRLADRLGGHLVQGHVDATGTIAARAVNPDGSHTLRVDAPPAVTRLTVAKGSITVDGVSLTVVEAETGHFTVAVIPHTQAGTTLGTARVGARVNLEVDVVAKYVEHLLAKEHT